MMRIRIPRVHWFTQPFMKNILANTLGTIIGIGLTIGTTYLVTNLEDRKSEQQEVKMLVRSLDNHIDKYEGFSEALQESDSVSAIYFANRHNLSALGDSTLLECMYRILYFQNPINDFTAAHIFESSVETWRTIRSVEFIEIMGKCFALSQMLTDYHKQINGDKERLMPIFFQAELEEGHNTRGHALRFLSNPEVMFFMRKQHDFYVMMMGQGVRFLKIKLEECKQLAGITENTSQEVLALKE